LALLALAVLGVTLLAHWPVINAGAINLDDQRYLFDNPVLMNPSWTSASTVLCEVFQSSTIRGYYEPLTLLSLMLDVAAGGTQDNLRPFHITSLALHLFNTLLVIVLIYMLFGRPWTAAAIGLIFGAHPLTVEPVAWVWERKTLLSAFFALWCIILYVRHVRRPSLAGYVGLPVLFVLALMAKPTVTPLPALLLLMDFWPFRRLSARAVIEKIPLFAIAGISSIITVVSTARTGSATLLGDYSLIQLPLKICYLIAFYLCKIVWPKNLSSIYVLPQPMSLSHPWVLAGVVCTCVLIVLLVVSLRRTRAAVMAGLFFIVAMSPTLGVVQYSWVAASDKYVYIPAFGLLIALAVLLEWIVGDSDKTRPAWRPAVVGIAVATVAALLIANTRGYLRQWRNTKQLTSYMLDLAPDSPYARFCQGNVLNNDKEYGRAIAHFDRAIELKPGFAMAYNNRGSAYASDHNYDLAIRDCGKAIEIKPDYVEAYYNRGIAYMGKGDCDSAIRDYTKAIELVPNDAKVYNNRGNAYAAKHDYDRAIQDGSKAIELKPRFADAYYNRAIAYGKKGDRDQAIRDYTKAIELDPNFVKAYNNRGLAYAE
jgi:tetratricopeptide (TPR) repeat protein